MSFSTGSECTEKLSTSTQTLAKSNQITQDGEKILSPQLKISPPLFLCFHEHHPPHPPTLPKNMSFAFIFHFFFNSPRSQLCESPSFTPFFLYIRRASPSLYSENKYLKRRCIQSCQYKCKLTSTVSNVCKNNFSSPSLA